MERNNNLKKAWAFYLKAVIPKDAPPVQVIETERGFYAGAFAVLEVLMAIEDESEEVGVEMLKGLSAEILTFSAHTAVAREAERG